MTGAVAPYRLGMISVPFVAASLFFNAHQVIGTPTIESAFAGINVSAAGADLHQRACA